MQGVQTGAQEDKTTKDQESVYVFLAQAVCKKNKFVYLFEWIIQGFNCRGLATGDSRNTLQEIMNGG